MIRIRYYLALPHETSKQEAEQLLRKLRQFCLYQQFKKVSTLVTCSNPALLNEAEQFPNQYFKQVSPKIKMGFTCEQYNNSRPFHVLLYKYPVLSGAKIPWFFDSCSNASQNTTENEFLGQHLTIIAALDEAKRLGFEVEVKDGGGFWKSRDINKLLRIKTAMAHYPDADQLLESVGKINSNLKENI